MYEKIFDEIGGRIVLQSDGWSENVVNLNERFQLDIDFSITNTVTGYDGWLKTKDDAYGICKYSGGGYTAVVGISLEHFGIITAGGEDVQQMLGRLTDMSTPAPAWAVSIQPPSNVVDWNDDYIFVSAYDYQSAVDGSQHEITNQTQIKWLNCDGNYYALAQRFQYAVGEYNCIVKTDLPIFATDADLVEYALSNGAITNKILNIGDPEEEYEEARTYKYAWNIYGHNANNSTQYTGFRNYRFFGGDGKICFHRVQATPGSPYTVKLYHYQNYTIQAAGVHDTDDEEFEIISNPELYFLHKSIQFSDNNYYTKFKFSTNLLVFGSQAQAQMWVDDLIDARAAENFSEVSRAYNDIIDPGYGDPENGNDNGLNGQSYVHGARLWVMSSSELNHFFDDIFDPVHITDILNATQLLGDGINAVQGISYFPIDIDDVATVNGSSDSIKIGSYTCPTATGRYVWNNNKMIDCGSLFIAPVYNDFRDYKIKLYIYLPYCGFHCLDPISKYMGKNLSVKYAVDITTGGCTAYVYANDIFLGDSYDGFMASQRPLTALDQTAYLNAVMGCVSSIATRETGMINSAAEGIAGAASGKVSGGVGPGGALNISMGAFGDLYKLSQAVKDTPMRTRGGFAGCLGFFGNQKIHVVTAQAKTIKPTLEQPLVGYPSHVSQTVGQFSGYLKCSYFKMADGFNGTLEELKEIIEMMQGGIYL